MEKLCESISALEREYVAFWQEVCNIESPTDCKTGVDSVGRLIMEKAKMLGFKIEICKQEVSGNAFSITMNETALGQPVCFSGHIDTVQPLGAFGYPPVKIKDGTIYGPGVVDCKGGVVAGLFAMNVLKEIGFSSRPVRLIVQSDEETSSAGSKKQTVRFMAQMAKDAVAFINCEGLRNGGMVLKRKGILRYGIKVKGKAAHASACTEGASAIAAAAHIILSLERFKDANGITANCGIIKGGTAANSVPDECEMEFDFRFTDNKQYAKIKEAVKNVCETVVIKGTSTEFFIKSERVSMEETEQNLKLYEKIENILEQNGMKRLGKTFSGGGSDASDMTDYGIPTVDGLGVYGTNIHSVKECADISSLSLAAKRLCCIALFIN